MARLSRGIRLRTITLVVLRKSACLSAVEVGALAVSDDVASAVPGFDSLFSIVLCKLQSEKSDTYGMKAF